MAVRNPNYADELTELRVLGRLLEVDTTSLVPSHEGSVRGKPVCWYHVNGHYSLGDMNFEEAKEWIHQQVLLKERHR